jgi:hypothetical protein
LVEKTYRVLLTASIIGALALGRFPSPEPGARRGWRFSIIVTAWWVGCALQCPQAARLPPHPARAQTGVGGGGGGVPAGFGGACSKCRLFSPGAGRCAFRPPPPLSPVRGSRRCQQPPVPVPSASASASAFCFLLQQCNTVQVKCKKQEARSYQLPEARSQKALQSEARARSQKPAASERRQCSGRPAAPGQQPAVTTQPLRRGSSPLQLAASPYGTRARSGTPL